MTKVLSIVISLIVLATIGGQSAWADGQILGNFKIIEESSGIILGAKGIEITVMNAKNAEPLMFNPPLVTDANGIIDTGFIPSGGYKIFGHYCDGANYAYSYVGGSNTELFDLASTVKVGEGQISEVIHNFPVSKVACDALVQVPKNPENSYLGIRVFDTKTQEGLEGINVYLIDPITAFISAKKKTDAKGGCLFANLKGEDFLSGPCKVRLVDPSGVYQSEYIGAGGEDNFALGAVLKFETTENAYHEEGLATQSVPGQIGTVIEDIINLNLGANVEDTLVSSLEMTLDFINDENPNNDKASCGILKGLLNQLNGRVNSGSISEGDAFTLEEEFYNIQTSLDCKK